MNLEEKRVFFAKRPNTTTINMAGKKFSLSNLSEEDRKNIMKRLAQKDEVLQSGILGILPGIKIDGKQVTKDNIHEFEIGSMKEKPKVVKKEELKEEIKEKPKEPENKKLTKKELESMTFKELKVIANSLGETGRSKVELINEILKKQ